MEIPNLSGIADPSSMSHKGSGNFKAEYINWSKTLQDIRDNAPGWMPEMAENIHGEEIHKAPDGSVYLMIRFRFENTTATTTSVPHAVMDHKMNSISGERVGARDIADSFVRGACKCAAAVFGYAWQMWSKDDPLERDDSLETYTKNLAETNDLASAVIEEEDGVKPPASESKKNPSRPFGMPNFKMDNPEVDSKSTKEGKVRQSTNNPLPKSWKDYPLSIGKYEGQTLGVVAETDEGQGYIKWMMGLEDIKDKELKQALLDAGKELQKNGQQGFGRIG
jgi:hypothetical protein